MPVQPAMKITGLKELQKTIRAAKSTELNREMKAANKAAATVVVVAAKPIAPVRSGRLAKSIKAANSAKYAAIVIGSAKRVPYAGPIIFGWPARNIPKQDFPTKAIKATYSEIVTTYTEAMESVARLLESL